MSAAVLSGKPLARRILQDVRDEAAELGREGVSPTLAVVVATGDAATHWYVRSIERAAQSAGLECRIADLGSDATAEDLARTLRELSADLSVNGIILQTPLPRGIHAKDLVHLVDPAKDVDGANPVSLGRLASGQRAFAPATARAVVDLLDHYEVPLAGQNVTVVGRSTVVGKPLSLLMLGRDATVTICHSRSEPLGRFTRPADVVVVAAGRAGLINGSHVSPNAAVIDVGTNVTADGSLAGDVDSLSVGSTAAALSPVPGGVGSVTTALLLLHTVEAALAQHGHRP